MNTKATIKTALKNLTYAPYLIRTTFRVKRDKRFSPLMPFRPKVSVDANRQQFTALDLVLVCLKLIDIPVGSHESPAQVISSWRGEVEVERCGQLSCNKVVNDRERIKAEDRNLRVSIAGMMEPSDIDVRTMPGWVEKARTLGLSVKQTPLALNIQTEYACKYEPAWTN